MHTFSKWSSAMLVFFAALWICTAVVAQQYTMQEVTDYKAAMGIQDTKLRKEALEKFLTDHPTSVLNNNIRIFLAETFEKLDDQNSQISTLETIIQSDPEFMEAYNRLALACLKKGETARAEEMARKALVLIEKKKAEDADMRGASPEQIVAFKREMTAAYKDTLAKVLIQAKKTDEAKALLLQVMEALPQQPETVLSLAESFKNLGDLDNALLVLDSSALKESPETEPLKKKHKELYVEKFGSEQGYEDRLAKAKVNLNEHQRKELLTGLIKAEGPEFAFSGLDNNPIGSRQLAGKIVILNFWATWCRPCHLELPHFQKAYEKYASDEKVAFLAVSTDAGNTKANVPSFISEKKFTFPIAYTSDDAKKFGFQGIPALFVLDGKGQIRFQRSGFNPNTDLVDELTWIIEELKKGQ